MKLPLSLSGLLALIILNLSTHAQCVQQVSAGISHSMGLKSDGTLWAWGFNGSGQLGDGTTVEKQVPIQVGVNSDWKMVSAGGNHTLAIKNDGTLWAWGYNYWGQVGDGTFANYITSPKKIGVANDWKYVSAGREFSVALKTDGTLWTWGDNFYGQLGYASTAFIPTKVGTDTNWKSVSAGGNHILAIKSDGSLWAWGLNLDNQLGDGTATDKNIPTKIGSATNWASVSAGYDFSVALKTDKTLWVWGNNDLGQLGNGTFNNITTPTQLGTESTWQTVSAGNHNTQATKSDGSLWAWGWIIGKFGFGTDNTNNVPTKIGIANNWNSVVSGDEHSFAFKTDGTLWAWGNGSWGRLGIDNRLDFSDPQLLAPAIPTAAPEQLFCKVATVADLLPSGPNTRWYAAASGGTVLPASTPLVDGQKYYASAATFNCESSSRVEVSVIVRGPTPIPAGPANQTLCPNSTIADIIVTGENLTWYDSNTNQNPLSTGNVLVNGLHYFASQTLNGCESLRAEFVITLSTPPAPTGQANQTYCAGSKLDALQATGSNITWYQPNIYAGPINANIVLVGNLHYYATQTINGCESTQRLDVLVTLSQNNTAAPLPMNPMIGDKVFAKESFTGIIDTEGALWGWGWNGEGQMADGSLVTKKSPVLIHEGPWKTIGAGSTAVLAIKNDGSLWAWGSNNYGQLGLGDGAPNSIHGVIQVGTANNWKDVASSYYTSAAIKTDGTLWTWGEKDILGDNGMTNFFRTVPAQVGTHTDWDLLSGGYHYFLGLKTIGFQYVWGTNVYGELGDETTSDRFVPIYNGTGDWKMVRGSYRYSVGISNSGTLWAWGSNENGCLGNGSLPSANRPTQIGSSSDWTDVAAGTTHCLAVKNDGTLWSWGLNNLYQLGDGTTTIKLSPVQIGADTDWKTVGAGSGYSVAIKSDGSVWTWGSNYLGNGTTTNLKTPTQILAGVQYICAASTLADLPVSGTNIRWYSDATANLEPLSPGTVLIDKTNYYATQTVNGCESPSRVSVFIALKDTNVSPPTGVSTQSFCGAATIADLKATGSNLKWYSSLSGGAPLSPTTSLIHQNKYYASQTIGTCESDSRLQVSVILTASTIPAPTGPGSQTFCSGALVENLTATGTTIKWYDAATAGSLLAGTTLLVHGASYYASQRSGTCESFARLKVLVSLSVVTPPVGNALQTFCGEATISNLTATGSTVKWYLTATGNGILPANTLLIDNNQYFASQTSGNCESTNRLVITAKVNEVPAAPVASAVQSFEDGQTIGDIDISGNDIKWYPSEADANNHTNILNESMQLESGKSYYATQTLSGCEGPPVEVNALLITGIEPYFQGMIVYPNPVKEILNISLNEIINNVTVTSSVDRHLIHKEVNDTAIRLDLGDLPCGMYFVRLQVKEKFITFKIVKE